MSTAKYNAVGVVSYCDPKQIHIEEREIKGYPGFVASSLGVIRRVSDGVYLKQRERPTSVGTYLAVQIIDDIPKSTTAVVHRLISIAFHGEPKQTDHEPNHLDGNKHNNRPDNLEWVTRGKNIQHSYEIGLRKDNREVTVTDHRDGRVWIIYSLSEFGRQFGVSKSVAWSLVTNHREKRYLDRYTFKVKKSVKVRKQPHTLSIRALDYVNKKLMVAEDSATLELETGVKRGTILWNLHRNSGRLLNGWVFLLNEPGNEFPVYTEQEIQESVDEHNKRPTHSPKRFGVVVRNYQTNQTHYCETYKDAGKLTGINWTTIRWLVSREVNDLRLVKGYSFKTACDKREFKEYVDEQIEVSLRTNKPEFPPIYGTDLKTNTTKLYVSKAEFALEIGANPVVLANWCRSNPDRPFKGRYRVEVATW